MLTGTDTLLQLIIKQVMIIVLNSNEGGIKFTSKRIK